MGVSDTLRFMNMVAPEDPATWFTIHHRTFSQLKNDYIFPGNAHKTIKTAINDAQYWAKKGHCVYISQGMYRNPGEVGGIYPKADRTYPNLVACKNLYIDVDVKDDAYHSPAEMRAKVQEFLLWAKLPMPTVIVGSGSGGWHLYWTLDSAIDLAEFKNLAGRLISAGVEFGLLFDRQCSRDATRLLRVPGTWNFKYASDTVPATSVTLDYCGTEHISVEAMRKGLARWPVALTHESKAFVVSGMVDAHGLPLDENADLTGGMKREYTPTSIDEAAKHCPFIKNTLDAGGANLVGDPQWHTAISLACHVTEPRETAHRLCNKSQYYSVEGTDAKFDTAQLARANRPGIGPPKCATISIEREECKTCPHLALGTSPLSIGFKQSNNGHAYSTFVKTLGPQSIELPHPYYQDPKSLKIFRYQIDTGKSEDSGDGLVFEYPFLPGAMLEAGIPFQFVINTMQGERPVSKRFDSSIVADALTLARAFAAEGLPITIRAESTRQFMASFLQLLQSKNETLAVVPAFGWSPDKAGDMGFAFAGEFVSPAGTARCSRPHEGTENYKVLGDDQVWIDLAALIITPDRPDLACMVASSFGAPLVGMTGENGLLMGVVSPASGIGKSTALLTGQAVWSSPRVGGLSDTVNYTFAKCATLRHLPVFYDEIKGERHINAMTQIAFQLTGGREKGRSDRTGKMRKINEFKTLCGYAANGSIVAGVREEDKGTDASWLRIFEMQGIILPDVAPDFTSNVSHLLTKLELNYGGVGRRYAALLGQNHARISATLTAFKAQFGKELGANPKVERFWIGAIATTLLGAMLANSLGIVKFPLEEMKKFMFSEFNRMRDEMCDDPSDYTKETALMNTIGAFLNEKQPRNMVILDKTWTQPARPPRGYASILNEKGDTGWGKLEVQISGDPLMLRLSDIALTEWCAKGKRPKNILVSQMRDKLAARLSSGVIGAGSRLGGARENVWIISAAPNTEIAKYLEFTIHHKFLPP